MTDTVRTGKFLDASPELPEGVRQMIDIIERDAGDWAMFGDLIAVRCHEDPKHYNIVVARVVYSTDLVAAE